MKQRVSSYQLAVAAGQNVQERTYWLDKLSGPLLKSSFPYDFKKEKKGAGQNNRERRTETWQFPMPVFLRLMELCQGKTEVKLHMILVTVLFILLHKYTRNNDVIIGSPLVKQPKDVDFINTTLLFREEVDDNVTFKELLMQVMKTIIDANKNQNFPIENLVEHLNTGNANEGKEFDLPAVVILLENLYDKRFTGYIDYDMRFSFSLTSNYLEMEVEYDTLLYHENTIKQIIRHYTGILEQTLDNADVRLSDIDILQQEEKKQLLEEFNKPFDVLSLALAHQTIHGWFDEQVSRTPDKIAVIMTNSQGSLSYNQLNEQAQLFAWHLKSNGIQAGSITALMLIPSLEMVISILGILKAGSAFLPIEIDYPEVRIRLMLKDSNARILVTTSNVNAQAATFNVPLLLSDGRLAGHKPVYPPAIIPPSSHDLAYVIYTSGSTGKPRGVMVEHQNISAYMQSFYQKFQIDDRDTGIQLVSYAFDIFVEEMFTVLLKGGSFIIPGVFEALHVNSLCRVIACHNVSIIDCTPLQLNELNNYIKENPGDNSLKTVHTFISGGETLKKEYVDHLAQTGSVYNTYGPTETTICATYWEYPRQFPINNENILIGSPINGCRVYILDKNRQMVPIGVSGELYISGQGVARGYLNRPDLTAEKFDQDLWDRKDDQDKKKNENYQKFFRGSRGAIFQKSPPCHRFYKTGDLARWLPDGNIEFRGRVDFQVKIRGYRIELGEIENCLMTHDCIKNAVVTSGEDNKNKYLCAYIVLETDKHLANLQKSLREFLSGYLPDYMIPAFFMPLEKLPLTPNGKLDRRALPRPETQKNIDYVPPQDEIQRKLVAIWADILGIEPGKISIDDNFFHLGGHSLKATVLVSRIERQLNVNIPLIKIFETPYIRGLAEFIKQLEPSNITSPEPQQTLVLMREKSPADGHFFLVHDGSGEIEGYVEFCREFDRHANFNLWGIRAGSIENFTPYNWSTAEIAGKYIEKIKKIQPHGPYYIAGWSIGGTIAFEMALQLEQRGERISFAGLIDVVNPQGSGNENKKSFDLKSEVAWLREYLPVQDKKLAKKIKQVRNFNEIWPTVIHYLEKNNYTLRPIKEAIVQNLRPYINIDDHLSIRQLISLINRYRSLNHAQSSYFPTGKIQAKIHYFKASESPVIFSREWENFSREPLHIIEIPGNHFSILKDNSAHMAKTFSVILKADSQ